MPIAAMQFVGSSVTLEMCAGMSRNFLPLSGGIYCTAWHQCECLRFLLSVSLRPLDLNGTAARLDLGPRQDETVLRFEASLYLEPYMFIV